MTYDTICPITLLTCKESCDENSHCPYDHCPVGDESEVPMGELPKAERVSVTVTLRYTYGYQGLSEAEAVADAWDNVQKEMKRGVGMDRVTFIIDRID